MRMCELAFADLQGVVIDDREVQKPGLSFTVDTLAALRNEAPDRPLWFLIGADNLLLLPTWREHHRILELARVATFPRLGTTISADALAKLDLSPEEQRQLLDHALQLEPDSVSASSIRQALAAGDRNLTGLLPSVEDYILAHKLYQT